MPKIVEKLAEKTENAMLVKNVLDIMINEWSIEASVLTRYELYNSIIKLSHRLWEKKIQHYL